MTKMIACEAFTYAVLGCVVGCAIGLPLSKLLYDFLIAGHFPSAVWQFPITSLGIILLFVSIAAIAAVYIGCVHTATKPTIPLIGMTGWSMKLSLLPYLPMNCMSGK